MIKIKIKVGDVDIELTIAEARALSNDLNAIFGPATGTFPALPPVIPQTPTPLEYPWNLPVTCCASGL